MSDLISRQAAVEEIARRDTTDGTVKVYSGREVNAILSQMPSAQPEIIYCEDCKYYTFVTARCEVRGKGLYLIRGMEDFCSRAERRTDD